jgi:hypothetical protein
MVKLAKFAFWFGLVVASMPGAKISSVPINDGLTVDAILAAGETLEAACDDIRDPCTGAQTAIMNAIARAHRRAPETGAAPAALTVEDLITAEGAPGPEFETALPIPSKKPVR